MSKFSISALMPVRNGANYLQDSIKSINANISELSEIVVINDGSTDGTSKILSDWKRVNPKLRVLETTGIGLVAALNLGISVIQSDFIARFDVDDQYAGNRIQFQRTLLSSQTSAVFSDYQIFSGSRNDLGVIPSAIFAPQVSVSLIKHQRTPHPSAIINRIAMSAIGGYRVEDFPAEDLSLWLRLSRVGELKSIPQSLLRYRLSEASITSTQNRQMNSKRLELLAKIGINREDLDIAMEAFNSGQRIYKEQSFASAREILHLLDLKSACNYYGDRHSNLRLNKSVLNAISSFKSFSDLSSIAFKGFERKAYKKFQL